MTNEIAIRDGFRLPDRQEVKDRLAAVQNFQALVKNSLVRGHDFGEIPGIKGVTLLKPGAEKIAKLMGLSDHYEVMDKLENWDTGLFSFTVKTKLVSMQTGEVVSEGIGESNTYESKYRYRWLWPDAAKKEYAPEELEQFVTRTIKARGNWVTQYRVENDDLYSLRNTVLKMAKKRSLVDASLSAGRLSDIFTQDIEEIAIDGEYREVDEGASGRNNGNGAAFDADGNRTFANTGMLMKAARDELKFSSGEVCERLGVERPTEIGQIFANLSDAWQRLQPIPSDDGPVPDNVAESQGLDPYILDDL